MSEEKNILEPEKTLKDEVLDRVSGGADTCPHYNKVRKSNGKLYCLDCDTYLE